MCIFSDRYMKIFTPDPRFAIPGSLPHYAPDKKFKTEHMKLEFSFDINKRVVFGKAIITVKILVPSDRITLNAVNMQILSIVLGNKKPCKFDYDKSQITIFFDKPLRNGETTEVVIGYKIADPTLGVYFVGPNKHYPKNPVQIWTHSETEEARYWYPCHDSPEERFTAEMVLNVPQDFFALSNGLLTNITEDKKAGKKTYHWKMKHPISSYLLMFAIGKFVEIKDEWDGIPIYYYCEKGREEDTKRAFGKTPLAIDFFSKKIGVRYPYEKYAQVAVTDFIFGGMEHTTAVTQSDVALVDEKAAKEFDWNDMLMAHELAHHWFGDLLTCLDWSHAWLNEGFANYFEALFMEEEKGRDDFLYELYNNSKAYYNEDRDHYRRPLVTNIYIESNDVFDRHIYEKGGLVLHMIRNILGDEIWWRCIHKYVEQHKNKSVETEDLISSITETSGKNMKKFFDQWVYGTGHPELKASYYWDEKSKEAVIRTAQIQKIDDQTPIFSLPLTIEIVSKDGTKRMNENFEEKQKQFRYKLPGPPLDIRIDPDNFLIKKLDFIKPRDMWIYQLYNDSNVIGRIIAAQELAKIGTNDIVRTLSKQFENENFWGVQAEIALALSTIKTEAAFKALQRMSETKNLKVKRHVASALGEFKTSQSFELLKKMLSDKTSYLVPSAAARSIGKTRVDGSMEILKKNISDVSWNDVIKAGVLDGIAQLTPEEAIPILKLHAQAGYFERSRMAAIRNLGLIGKGRKDVLDLLLELTHDRYALVQLASVIALGDLGDERAVPRLDEITKGHFDGRVKRQSQESIRKLYVWLDTDLETAEMKERYDKLKKENNKK